MRLAAAAAAGGGGVVLRGVKPCSRCKVPTIDQATGEVGDEPAETMAGFRSGETLGWVVPAGAPAEEGSWSAALFFGMNMVAAASSGGGGGCVTVGDGVSVVERRSWGAAGGGS